MNRNLLLVTLSLSVWGIGETTFYSYQALYLERLGATPIVIGIIYSGYGFANMVAHIPAGWFADHFGRRQVMWAAWLLGLLATVLMAIATTLPVFIAGMWIYGITLFVLAPLNSYVTAARGSLSVGRAISLVSAGFNTGAIFGPLLGGWVGENFGYRMIFVVAAILFTISTSLILLIKPQPVEHDSSLSGSLRGGYRPVFTIFLGIIFLANFSMYLPQPLTPNYLETTHQINLLEIGSLYTIAGIGIVVFNIVLGALSAVYGFLIGLALMGIHSWLLYTGSDLFWFYPAFFFLGGFRTARILIIAQIRSLVPSGKMGLAYGITETVGSAAILLAPLLAGWLYTQAVSLMYPVSTTLIILTIIAGIIFYHKSGWDSFQDFQIQGFHTNQ